MTAALLKEMEIQDNYLGNEAVETIYFGGGTPSLLDLAAIQRLLDKLQSTWQIIPGAEITLETNPDDIDEEKLRGWKAMGINRLSIGIQSFFNEDLQWMNRAHNATQARESLAMAKEHFDNITADLIYGTAFLSSAQWKQNVDTLIALSIPHLSCYALTVEPKTALYKMINQGKIPGVDPDKQSEQFLLLMQWMEEAGYEHYEISNFAKPGFRSRHNSSYWQGKKYLGLGPAAHSFNGESRQWNVSNNQQYIASVNKGAPVFEKEILTPVQHLNEYIMTSLRTSEGLQHSRIDKKSLAILTHSVQKYIDNKLLEEKNGFFILTKEGKLLADGIAADLFFS